MMKDIKAFIQLTTVSNSGSSTEPDGKSKKRKRDTAPSLAEPVVQPGGRTGLKGNCKTTREVASGAKKGLWGHSEGRR